MRFFRVVSVLEGISYLVILSVTAGFISREYVFPLGATHGALFLLYMFASLQTSHRQGWSIVVWLLIFLAAVVPFAFIPVELFLRKQQEKGEQPATPA